MYLKSTDQLSLVFTVTQLPSHHCEFLIPTSEMFHIFVTIILANIVVELSPV